MRNSNAGFVRPQGGRYASAVSQTMLLGILLLPAIVKTKFGGGSLLRHVTLRSSKQNERSVGGRECIFLYLSISTFKSCLNIRTYTSASTSINPTKKRTRTRFSCISLKRRNKGYHILPQSLPNQQQQTGDERHSFELHSSKYGVSWWSAQDNTKTSLRSPSLA